MTSQTSYRNKPYFDANLKGGFVAQYKNLNIPKVTVDVTQLKQHWNILISAASLKGNVGLSDEKIYSEFLRETGLLFPDELKIMCKVCNGIEQFLNSTTFLSAEKVLEEWRNWKAIYQASNYMDIIGEYPYKDRSERTVPIYVNPYRIPFIHDGGGNFIGIDMLPNRAGRVGQIIAFGVDEMAIRYIADDMNDFIRQFLDGGNPMENDKLSKKMVIGY